MSGVLSLFSLLVVLAATTTKVGAFSTNAWIGGTGSWSNASKWSLGVVPTAEHDVQVLSTNTSADGGVLYIDSLNVEMNSLLLDNLHDNNKTTILWGCSSVANPLPPNSRRVIKINTALTVVGAALIWPPDQRVAFADSAPMQYSAEYPDDPTLTAELYVGGSGGVSGSTGTTNVITVSGINAEVAFIRPKTFVFVNSTSSSVGLTGLISVDAHANFVWISATVYVNTVSITGQARMYGYSARYSPAEQTGPPAFFAQFRLGTISVGIYSSLEVWAAQLGRSVVMSLDQGSVSDSLLSGPQFLQLEWSNATTALDSGLVDGGFNFVRPSGLAINRWGSIITPNWWAATSALAVVSVGTPWTPTGITAQLNLSFRSGGGNAANVNCAPIVFRASFRANGPPYSVRTKGVVTITAPVPIVFNATTPERGLKLRAVPYSLGPVCDSAQPLLSIVPTAFNAPNATLALDIVDGTVNWQFNTSNLPNLKLSLYGGTLNISNSNGIWLGADSSIATYDGVANPNARNTFAANGIVRILAVV